MSVYSNILTYYSRSKIIYHLQEATAAQDNEVAADRLVPQAVKVSKELVVRQALPEQVVHLVHEVNLVSVVQPAPWVQLDP